MKPVERFFRKYFLSMVGIIVLFLLLNVVLFFSVRSMILALAICRYKSAGIATVGRIRNG